MTVVVAPTRSCDTSRGIWSTQGQGLRRARSVRAEAICEQALAEQASLSTSCSASFRNRRRARVRPAPMALVPRSVSPAAKTSVKLAQNDIVAPVAPNDPISGVVQNAVSILENTNLDPEWLLESIQAVKTPPPWQPPPMPVFDGLIPMIVEAPQAASPSAAKHSPTLLSKVLNKMLPLKESLHSPRNWSKMRGGMSPGSSPAKRNGSKTSLPELMKKAASLGRKKKATKVKESPRGEDSRLKHRRGAVVQEGGGPDESEMSAFRIMLCRMFGNLTLAFRALKNATDTEKISNSKGSINIAEMEWLVTRYLHYGDKHLARRLFDGITNRRDTMEITLLQFCGSQPIGKGESLLSLLELRHRLIHRFTSLTKAFKELEDYICERDRQEVERRGWCRDLAEKQNDKVGQRLLRIGEFTDAAQFFGLDEFQAQHFFTLMDANGDGDLTLDEFLQALTKMPAPTLLGDLRQRLLAKYHSVPGAIKELQADGPPQVDSVAFAHSMMRIGISDIEAHTIFDVIDTDGSGTIDMQELRDALREVSPRLTLDEFWQRFAKQWPEVVEAARGSAQERRGAGDRLSELLPSHLRGTKAHPLIYLTADAFDALCQILDIGRENGAELFSQCVKAARLQRGRLYFDGSEDSEVVPIQDNLLVKKECDLEDFFGVLRIWLDSHQDVQQHLGGVRTKLVALKALLLRKASKESTGRATDSEAEREDLHLQGPSSIQQIMSVPIRGRWR